ncbi:MAG TPA: RcnB family protein [Phenylobacterium sp.]|uniref:RcnB family protein n=1 Tax=Phenylobacterium sp. TaxID=1871053 RepID=UPI002CD8EF73|nr:RcnB family protein [Phenylobacterium sp.]HSV03885.1 RcnB family protein [Phenylobacterium sp.]
MRRLVPRLAALLLTLAPFAAGAAVAREHGGWEHGRDGHGGPAAGAGWARHEGERAPPPGWARGDGRGGGGGGWTGPPGPSPYGYGPPPGHGAYGPNRRYGVRRGGYLPPEVRGGVVGDYGRYRLRPPPRGYTWVRVGNAFLLVNMASGQIFDVIED